MQKHHKQSHDSGVKSAAQRKTDTRPASSHLVDNRPENSFQRKAINEDVAQLAKVTRTKGNIIDSVLINKDGSKAKDGKVRKGAIAGGVQHDGGTPGTAFAGNVKTASGMKATPWLGGHVYKHQWGGSAMGGNVVVWPSTVEKEWAKGFEDPVQEAIDRGERAAIGVSWTSEDELVPKATVDGYVAEKAIADGTKRVFVEKSAELARRKTNTDLSYIPTVIAGSFNGQSTVIGSSATLVDQAVAGAKTILKNKIPNLEKEYDTTHTQAYYPDKKKKLDAEHGKTDLEGKLAKLEGERVEEDSHKGSFGNVSITRE